MLMVKPGERDCEKKIDSQTGRKGHSKALLPLPHTQILPSPHTTPSSLLLLYPPSLKPTLDTHPHTYPAHLLPRHALSRCDPPPQGCFLPAHRCLSGVRRIRYVEGCSTEGTLRFCTVRYDSVQYATL
jgi:hypothetical protein